jgi:hypothetical protein
MVRPNPASMMLLDNNSLSTAPEPAIEPCWDSVWVEGSGPITKLHQASAQNSSDYPRQTWALRL